MCVTGVSYVCKCLFMSSGLSYVHRCFLDLRCFHERCSFRLEVFFLYLQVFFLRLQVLFFCLQVFFDLCRCFFSLQSTGVWCLQMVFMSVGVSYV